VRANWSAVLGSIPDFRGEIVRSAVEGDTVLAEVDWTGTKANGMPLDARRDQTWACATSAPGRYGRPVAPAGGRDA
jgi:hypothetical protein